jgi:hypothetical protein
LKNGARESVGWDERMAVFANQFCTIEEVLSNQHEIDTSFFIKECKHSLWYSSLMIDEVLEPIDDIVDRILNLVNNET